MGSKVIQHRLKYEAEIECLMCTSSCACFATCSNMSLQYIFVILCRHAPIRSIGTMDCQSGRSWEQYSVCGDDPSIQQSSHAAVYMLLHNFTFTLLSTSLPSFQPLVQ